LLPAVFVIIAKKSFFGLYSNTSIKESPLTKLELLSSFSSSIV
jgi:hypothetical protein